LMDEKTTNVNNNNKVGLWLFHEAFTIFSVQQKRLDLYAPQLQTMTAGSEDLATLTPDRYTPGRYTPDRYKRAGIHLTGTHQAGIHQTGIQQQVLCSH